jgi:hypothetical protein
VVSACVVEYRALQLNTVMEVVAGALGGSVDKPATADRRVRPRQRKRGKPSEKPDAAAQFAALGLPVASVRGDGSAPAR